MIKITGNRILKGISFPTQRMQSAKQIKLIVHLVLLFFVSVFSCSELQPVFMFPIIAFLFFIFTKTMLSRRRTKLVAVYGIIIEINLTMEIPEIE